MKTFTLDHSVRQSLSQALFFVCLLTVCLPEAKAQGDFNLLQYYNTPLLTNPAMIATRDEIQLFLNYKHQPNAVGDDFTTTMLTGIYPFLRKKDGHHWGSLSAAFVHDQNGALLRTNGGVLAGAYNLKLGNRNGKFNFLSLGLQGAYFQRRLNIDNLTTSSQFDQGFFDPNADIGEFVDDNSQNFATLGGGIMWHQKDSLGRESAYLGVSVNNLNTPKTNFLDNTDDQFPRHITVTGGVRVFENYKLSVSPNIRWIRRTGNNEVIAGSFLNYRLFQNKKSGTFREGFVSLGLWYNFNDAFIGALQWEQPKYYLTFSLDIPTANTTDVWQGNSAFEVTVGLRFQKRRRKEHLPIPYPLEPVQDWTMEPFPNPPVNVQKVTYTPTPPSPKTKPALEDGAVRFAYNNDGLDKRSQIILDSVIQVLQEFPEAIIEFAGHTCDIGAEESNYKLSFRRAESVKAYLARQDLIDPKRIVVKAYGESQPLVPNISEENRVKNRRVAYKIRFPDSY